MIDREWADFLRRTRRLAQSDGLPWVVSIVVVLIVGSVLSWVFWDCLHDDRESVSSTVRNLGLVIGAVVAALLAVWRSRVAERQASAAHHQVEVSQQELLNERYQRGAEMLGSAVLAVRLRGIYALQSLADEHPKEYHIQIMRLLCAFVRNPTVDGNGQGSLTDHETGKGTETDDGSYVRLRQDVEDAMEAIASRSKKGIGHERDAGFILDIRGAKLRGLDLMNLENVDLSWANISNADLSHVNLRPHTDMSWVHAVNANLAGACLVDVNLSVVRFWGRGPVSNDTRGCEFVEGCVFEQR